MSTSRIHRKTDSSLFSGMESEVPSIEVVDVKEHGLIFKSPCFFDLGTSVEMTIQVAFIGDSDDARAGKLGGETTMNVGGVVVDCQLCESPSGEVRWEATLLFEDLEEEQKVLLKYASCLGGSQHKHPMLDTEEGHRARSPYRLPDAKKLGALFGPN
jgi:hypothetical protein